MATCKECTHYDVCGNRKEILSSGIRVLDSIDVENVCPYFKDRSRLVEPPCKVGDTVYALDYDNAIDEFFAKKKNIVEERHVQRIEIHKNNEFKIFDTPAYGEPPKKLVKPCSLPKKPPSRR